MVIIRGVVIGGFFPFSTPKICVFRISVALKFDFPFSVVFPQFSVTKYTCFHSFPWLKDGIFRFPAKCLFRFSSFSWIFQGRSARLNLACWKMRTHSSRCPRLEDGSPWVVFDGNVTDGTTWARHYQGASPYFLPNVKKVEILPCATSWGLQV